MSTGKQLFTKRAFKRAYQAAKEVGVETPVIEIDRNGTMRVVCASGTTQAAAGEPNEWDEIHR